MERSGDRFNQTSREISFNLSQGQTTQLNDTLSGLVSSSSYDSSLNQQQMIPGMQHGKQSQQQQPTNNLVIS